jgi:2-dehydro-3-deoxygluconokinase
MPTVVATGETMLLVTPSLPGRLRHAENMSMRIGGAESNFAIGLTRLGMDVGWVSWLGQDEAGEVVLWRIRGEGVDVSQVQRKDAPTGLYLRERVPEGVRVYYYRRGSAASMLEPGAFDPSYLEGARFFHLTGITAALSQSCREYLHWAIDQARARGVRISFDVNYRAKLWSAAEARQFIEGLLPKVDVLFVGNEEATALWGRADLGLLKHFQFSGPQELVLKLGSKGCLALVGDEVAEAPVFKVSEIDPIGAGDAFDAGYIYAWLQGFGVADRLRMGNAMGAYSVMSLGDYEGLPSRNDLEAFLSGKSSMGR